MIPAIVTGAEHFVEGALIKAGEDVIESIEKKIFKDPDNPINPKLVEQKKKLALQN